MAEILLRRKEAAALLTLSPSAFDRLRMRLTAIGHPFTAVSATGNAKGLRFKQSELEIYLHECEHADHLCSEAS